MLVIPAVDIKGGKVVRLAQGLAEKKTIYPGIACRDGREMGRLWS